MSDYEKIEMLNQRLKDMETRSVPVWQRPINEVARLALIQEITLVGQQISRWHRAKATNSSRPQTRM